MEAAPAKTNRPDRATGGKVRPSRLLREYGCVSQISPDGPAAPLLSQAQSTGFREDFPKFSHIAISSPNALAWHGGSDMKTFQWCYLRLNHAATLTSCISQATNGSYVTTTDKLATRGPQLGNLAI